MTPAEEAKQLIDVAEYCEKQGYRDLQTKFLLQLHGMQSGDAYLDNLERLIAVEMSNRDEDPEEWWRRDNRITEFLAVAEKKPWAPKERARLHRIIAKEYERRAAEVDDTILGEAVEASPPVKVKDGA